MDQEYTIIPPESTLSSLVYSDVGMIISYKESKKEHQLVVDVWEGETGRNFH